MARTGNAAKSFQTPRNKSGADKINAALMVEREKLLFAAFQLEQEADNLEMYLSRIETAKKVLANCVDALSRDTRDVCGLDRCRYY